MEENVCPECKGAKMVPGNCECNSEWREVDNHNTVNDCICDPDTQCPTCKGTGVVNPG